MEVDAALILILSILVWLHGKAGPWVIACGLMRYTFVAAGWCCRGWLALFAQQSGASRLRSFSSSDSASRSRHLCQFR